MRSLHNMVNAHIPARSEVYSLARPKRAPALGFRKKVARSSRAGEYGRRELSVPFVEYPKLVQRLDLGPGTRPWRRCRYLTQGDGGRHRTRRPLLRGRLEGAFSRRSLLTPYSTNGRYFRVIVRRWGVERDFKYFSNSDFHACSDTMAASHCGHNGTPFTYSSVSLPHFTHFAIPGIETPFSGCGPLSEGILVEGASAIPVGSREPRPQNGV
jgi:hypothetical protein